MDLSDEIAALRGLLEELEHANNKYPSVSNKAFWRSHIRYLADEMVKDTLGINKKIRVEERVQP
jgi:hypothetical protein